MFDCLNRIRKDPGIQSEKGLELIKIQHIDTWGRLAVAHDVPGYEFVECLRLTTVPSVEEIAG